MNKHHTYYLNCEEAPKQIYRHKYYMNGALPYGKSDWKGKPADWSDIRKDCPENSIALYAAHKEDYSQYDNLGFTATCIGGYNVFIDEKKYGTFTSGSQCSITWSEIDEELPVGYKRIIGMSMDNSCYYQTSYYPKGSDTLRFSYEWTDSTRACNVLGCYTTASAQDNLSLYIGNQQSAKYLRYNGGTYSSYSLADKRYDVTITPTGSIGMETEDTWEEKEFTCSVPLCIGITGTAATSAKFIGNLYGNVEIDNELKCIPCERISDGEIGYYDTYSQTFFEPTGTTPTSLGYDTSHLLQTGDNITTPSTLKAHKIWIEPATEGNDITVFKHQRVDSSVSHEEQGTLWIHFNLSNVINLNQLCSPYPYNYKVDLLEAVTAKNNIINFDITNNNVGTFRANSLEYLPVLKNMRLDDSTFSNSKIDKVILDSPLLGRENNYTFSGCTQLKQIKTKNPSYYQSSNYYNYFAKNTMLKEFPPIDWTNVVGAYQMWSDYNKADNNGKPTIIDASAATRLQSLGIFDTNTLVGLRVSNQAPFSNANSPQIDIHNTALDREALVTLFNSLPTVSNGQIINITGTTGAMNLSSEDINIAVNKGWTVVGGPSFTTYYKYNNTNEGDIYIEDDPPSYGNFVLQNATVVGSLTETQGVYSGFSSSSYLTLSDTFNANTYKILMKFKTGSSVSETRGLIRCYSKDAGFYLQGASHKLAFYNNNTSSASVGSTVLSTNTYYWACISYDGTATKIYADNGTHEAYTKADVPDLSDTSFWKQEISINAEFFNNASITLGYNKYSTSQYWNGLIDMNNSSLTTDGTTISFSYFPEISKIYNSSFQEITPQPYFTYGNGMLATGLLNGGIVIPVTQCVSSMELCIHFKTSSSWPNLAIFGGSKDNNEVYSRCINAQVYDSVREFRVWLSSNGSSNDIASDFNTGIKLNLNTEYWIKVTWDGTTYRFYSSTDGSEYTVGVNTKSSTSPLNFAYGNLFLGNFPAKDANGTVNTYYLDGTYAICDGVKTFDGSTAVEGVDFVSDGCIITGVAGKYLKIDSDYYSYKGTVIH